MAYGDFKDLNRRTASDKILRINIAKNPIYDGCQRGLASMVYKFFDKKTSGGVATLARSETLQWETLATRAKQTKSAVKNENM